MFLPKQVCLVVGNHLVPSNINWMSLLKRHSPSVHRKKHDRGCKNIYFISTIIKLSSSHNLWSIEARSTEASMEKAICHTFSVWSSSKRSGKVKVGYFDVEISVHQQVYRIYTTMDYSTRMNRVQASHDLLKVVPTGLFV